MIFTRRLMLLGGGALFLAGCGSAQMAREAGSDIDEGGFGNATAHNRALMTGRINAGEMLSRRFAAEVPTTVHFDFNRTELDAEAQAALLRQAAWIRTFPEVRFSVYGHTDLVGTERYNHALGRRRAQVVVDFLARNGISRSRLQALVSRGEREPLIQTQQPERQNRRAVTQVAGFVRRHPTVMNGEYAAIIHREFVASATMPHPYVWRSVTR